MSSAGVRGCPLPRGGGLRRGLDGAPLSQHLAREQRVADRGRRQQHRAEVGAGGGREGRDGASSTRAGCHHGTCPDRSRPVMSSTVPRPTSGKPACNRRTAGLASSSATRGTSASWSRNGCAARDHRCASALTATHSAPPPRASSAAPAVANPAPRSRTSCASGAAARADRKATPAPADGRDGLAWCAVAAVSRDPGSAGAGGVPVGDSPRLTGRRPQPSLLPSGGAVHCSCSTTGLRLGSHPGPP